MQTKVVYQDAKGEIQLKNMASLDILDGKLVIGMQVIKLKVGRVGYFCNIALEGIEVTKYLHCGN